MILEIILIIFGVALVLAGVVGSIIPSVPGPTMSYVALIVLELATDERIFSTEFWVIFLIVTIVVSLSDNVLPVVGAKAYGASKYGIWGSIIGLILGMIFFPPFGMIVGVLVGAIAGELIAGKKNSEALKAGIATFIGNIFSIFLKFAASVVMAFYYFIKTVDVIGGWF